LKQSYPKIRAAGAELAMICPDPAEEHRRVSLALFGEELPYLYVPDPDLAIARRYALLRTVEHAHGGFYYRSLWVVDGDGIITQRVHPWAPTGYPDVRIEEFQRLFTLIGAEPGEWVPTCGLNRREASV